MKYRFHFFYGAVYEVINMLARDGIGAGTFSG
jgi:hypothetical protein